MKRALSLLTLAALTACGGGGVDPIEAKLTVDVRGLDQPTTPPVPKNVLITQYGDSTTVGWTLGANGVSYVVSPKPVEQLQALLQAKYGERVTVQEYAHNGWSLRDLLAGTNGIAVPLAQAVKEDKGQIATLRYGLNDKSQYGTAEFKGYLVATVQLLQGAGKKVVMEEPNPTTDGTAAPYAKIAAQVAMEFGLPLVANHSLAAWSTPLSDGIHPTAAQYVATVPAQVPVLVPVIDALTAEGVK